MNNHTNKKSSIQGKNMFNIGKESAKQGKELEQQEQLESVSTIYELPLKQATNLLKNMGENWRKDNTEKKNGKEIIKRVPPRIIADDLKQVVQFAVIGDRSEEHTSELQSRFDLVCRLLLEKQKNDRLQKSRAA